METVNEVGGTLVKPLAISAGTGLFVLLLLTALVLWVSV